MGQVKRLAYREPKSSGTRPQPGTFRRGHAVERALSSTVRSARHRTPAIAGAGTAGRTVRAVPIVEPESRRAAPSTDVRRPARPRGASAASRCVCMTATCLIPPGVRTLGEGRSGDHGRGRWPHREAGDGGHRVPKQTRIARPSAGYAERNSCGTRRCAAVGPRPGDDDPCRHGQRQPASILFRDPPGQAPLLVERPSISPTSTISVLSSMTSSARRPGCIGGYR